MKRVLITLLLIGSTPVLASPTADQLAARIEQAETLYAEAKAGENSWVMTRRLIDEARAHLEAGELEAAAPVADRALRSATASVEQMNTEKTAWRSRVPGN